MRQKLEHLLGALRRELSGQDLVEFALLLWCVQGVDATR